MYSNVKNRMTTRQNVTNIVEKEKKGPSTKHSGRCLKNPYQRNNRPATLSDAPKSSKSYRKQKVHSGSKQPQALIDNFSTREVTYTLRKSQNDKFQMKNREKFDI